MRWTSCFSASSIPLLQIPSPSPFLTASRPPRIAFRMESPQPFISTIIEIKASLFPNVAQPNPTALLLVSASIAPTRSRPYIDPTSDTRLVRPSPPHRPSLLLRKFKTLPDRRFAQREPRRRVLCVILLRIRGVENSVASGIS